MKQQGDGGGLAVRSGYADQLQFFRRIAEEIGRDLSQGQGTVLHPYIGYAGDTLLRKCFTNDGGCTLFHDTGDETMPVGLRSAHCNKERSVPRFPRIETDIHDLGIGGTEDIEYAGFVEYVLQRLHHPSSMTIC